MLKYVIGIIVVLILIVGGYFAYKGYKPAPAQETATTTQQAPTTATYASSTMGISITYPLDFMVDENYQYTQVNPKKPINGVKFTIPGTMATGTNLSSDTYVSVEQLPRAKSCTGDIFLAANVKPQTVTDNGVTYSLATSSGAAAGNQYDEAVYALEGSQPCTAVRYFIHSSNIGNYPPGSVNPFDQQTLLSVFDDIRRSLVLGSGAPESASSTLPTGTEAPAPTQ